MRYGIELSGKRIVLLLFFFLSVNVLSFSQSGPGGIGNADGSNGEPELKLWLLPDSLGVTDGDEINTWKDYSGNSNDLTGAGTNGNPVLRKDTINGHDAVFFEADISRAVINNFDMPSEAVSVFFVLRTDGTQRLSPLSYAASDDDDNEYMFINDYPNSGDFATFVKGNDYSEPFTYNDNEWKILTHQWGSVDGRMYLHENGTEIFNTFHQAGATINSGGTLSIGAEQDDLNGGYQSDDDFQDGEMAEFIMYGSSLKQAQRVVIENYLAQKYGLDDSLSIDRYVPEDSSYIVSMTGMGRESDGITEAFCDGLVITQNGGFENGEYILTAHDGTENSEDSINSDPEVTNCGVDSAWNRAWYIDKTVNDGVNARIAFDFGEGIDGNYPGELSNYRLMYRGSLKHDYDTVDVDGKGVQNGDQIYFEVPDEQLEDGYYTLGTVNEAESPLIGEESQTWYTLKSGDWEDWETWTLDPSGALPDNPAKETPSAVDDVVILSGKTVTVNTDNVSANDLSVKGRIDFQGYTGQSFGTIRGGGRILLSEDNFPSGDASHFITEGKGEGTVVYYGSDNFILNQALEFYNLEIEMNNTSDTLTLLKDYTINGDFFINEGTFQVNSDTSGNNDLTVDVEGNLLVENNGAIATGKADARHQLNLYGDFINDGTAKFTNRNSANYGSEATNGIVDANFLNTTSNQKIQCNNTTNFYRIEIDKGSQTYQLSIEASDASYFNLYGHANESHGSNSQLTDNENALGLISGTVRLKNNVNVPILNNSGNYNVSESARLWIDGGSTAKNNGTAIVPYGVIRVSDGTLDAPINSGITTRENGLVKVEGGTLSINQLRTSVFGDDNVGGYVQTGGTTNILGGNTSSDYYCFNLTYPGNVFNMSGGTLHIHQSEGKGAIFIASDEVNQNVTGGTVIMEIDDGEDFPITSKAPFWNVIIRNSDGGNGKHIITSGTDVGSTDEYLPVQDLHVLNNLTLETGTTRSESAGGESNTYGSYLDLVTDTTTADLYVGKNLTMEDSTVLDVWGWTGSNNSTSATLIFNGSSDGIFHIGDITSYTNALLEYESPDAPDGGPAGNWPSDGTGGMHPWKYNLPLYNLKIDKPDATLSLSAKKPGKGGSWGSDGGQAGNWVHDEGGKNTRRWLSKLISIKNQFKLLNGTFSQIDPHNTVTFAGNGGEVFGSVGDMVGYSMNLYTTDIENRDTLFVYEPDVTPKEGIIAVRSPNPLTIQSTDGAYFGNMRFIDDHDNPVTLTSDVHFGRIEYFNGTIDIGKHNLKVDLFETYAVDKPIRMDAVATGQPVFGVPNFIRMDGNASDGGLSLKVPKVPTWPLPNKDEFEYLSDTWDSEQGPYAFPDRLWFPVGTDASGSDKYTPAVCRLHDYGTTDGDEYITVRVVDQELQTTDLSGGDVLSYYWNVDFEGYDAGEEPTVSWIFQYDDADLDIGAGDETQFVPGKVIDGDDYTRSDEGDVNAVKDGGSGTIEGNILGSNPANIVIFNGTGSSGSPDSDDDIEGISSTMFDIDASGPNINSNWQNAWPNTGFTLEKANYTAGESSRFVGAPEIFYTYKPGDGFQIKWDNGDNWTYGNNNSYDPHDSRQSPAGDYPKAGDVAVIGWVPYGDPGGTDGYPHGIAVDDITVDFAEIKFSQMEDTVGNPTARKYTYNFQFRPTVVINNAGGALNGGKVSGEGLFWMRWGGSQADPDFSGVDIGEFVSQDSSYFVYESKSGVYNNVPSELPNLLIAGDGWGANDQDFELATDIKINANFELLGDINLILSSGATGDVIVENDLRIFRSNANGNESGGFGRIDYPNDASRSIEVYEDLRLENEQAIIQVANPNTTVNESHLIVHGNIIQDNTSGGGLQLFSAVDEDYVKLSLQGSGNHYYTLASGAIANFYNIEFNKGTDTTSTFTFENNFTLNGPTSGVDVPKALELKNGKLIMNDPNINVDLTTGDDDFYIPASAALEVRQGQANASGNSGILLDGKLNVNGGTVDMSGGDNYIEYSASGNATIEVSSDSLIVGSQIRRGLTSTEGILNYSQTGGTVIVGNDEAPENNRGVFEILNNNSSFNHTGGDLYIARAQDNPSIASFYLDPESSNFGEDAKLHLGYTTTPSDEIMGIYSTVAIPNLVANDTSGNNPTIRQWTIPLTITDSLEINAGAAYDANGLDLTLEGDLIANGSFISNNNTTYFSGNSNQQIVGSPDFWDLIKGQPNTLALNNEISVSNNLKLEQGTLDDNGNTLHAKGDVWMDATHNHGGSGDGIAFDGSELQVLQSNSGTATFGKLSINNPGGPDSVAVSVPDGNEVFVESALQMKKGILDIGKNLLVLEENAEIIDENPFSPNNMIQTNISFTDAGIQKYYPAISSDTLFTYPIGSKGKYTPVEFDISNKDAGGSIRVKAADEIHPTIVNDSEPCQEIHDTSNVLKYHWIIEADGVSNFSADAYMKYYKEDIQIDNSLSTTSYDTTDYIAARLLLDSLHWNKFGPDNFNETDQQLEINFSGTDDQGISGEYTAGVEDQDGSCEGAIPNEVPIYISTTNGDWSDENIWDTYPEGGGTIPGGGPKGAAVIIEDTVTIQKNYIVGYKTTIDTGGVDTSGVLKLGQTYGHRLGLVNGKGTLQIERGDLPAGVYKKFFSAGGGTLEFSGTGNYDVLGGISQLNNLKFSGTGERRLANLDLGLYGNLEIMGDDNNLQMINEHDKNLAVEGDITFTQGQIDAGNSSSTLLLKGSAEQAISGNFTGSNAWYNVELDNPSNVVIEDSLNLTGNLTFASGRIVVPDTALLTVDNSSQAAINDADNTKYVDGPLRKKISDGGSFIFPVGYSDYYGEIELLNVQSSGAEYWETQYYHYNPYNDGYYPDSTASPLVLASQEEYWRVKGPASVEQADVKINWNSESNISALVPTKSELSIAEWDDANIEWIEVGNNASGDLTSGSATTSSPRDLEEHQYTFASTDYTFPTVDPDPVETDICEGNTATVRFDMTGESPWDTLIYNHPAVGNDTIYDINSTPLEIDTLTAGGDYYAIKIVDNNGNEGTELGDTVNVTVHSPPSPEINGDTAVCEGGLITYDVTQESDHYYSWSVSAEGTIESGGGTYNAQIEWQSYGTGLVEVTEGIQNVAGCETTVDTSVNIYETPEPNATATPVQVCYPDTVDLDAGDSPDGPYDFDYSWTPSDSVENEKQEKTYYAPGGNLSTESETINFEVEVINAENNTCRTSDNVEVTIFRQPETGNLYYIPNDFDL